MENNIANISSALVKAQYEFDQVIKDEQGYGYKYATLSNCMQVIKKPLYDNGLSIIQPVESDEQGGTWIKTMLIHESGETLTSHTKVVIPEMKGVNAAQALGSAISYMRRYALAAMLGLAQYDDDGQSVSQQPQQKKQNHSSQHQNNKRHPQLQTFINNCQKFGIDDIKRFANWVGLSSSDDIETLKHVNNNFKSLSNKYNYEGEAS
jgi:hypothetical protein